MSAGNHIYHAFCHLVHRTHPVTYGRFAFTDITSVNWDVVTVCCRAALVKALGCSGLAAPVRAACADCAFKIVRSMASAVAGGIAQKSLFSEVLAMCC